MSHCGQTVGWIKIPLGTKVGHSPGHIALDGDPVPSRKGAQQPLTFRPMSVVAKGWMDQDTTWYGGRCRPRRHCVRWGPSSPHGKGHSSPSPLFRPMSIVAKRSPISTAAELLRAERQTQRQTYRHADCNTLHPCRVEAINSKHQRRRPTYFSLGLSSTSVSSILPRSASLQWKTLAEPVLEVGRYGMVSHTGASSYCLKPYRHFQCDKYHSGMPNGQRRPQ